uniref:3'-5' exonuclease domain-containing protein n=1 Tax=Monodelphis domestica TaxID=13616 RepID=K7E1H7_MONDO
MGEGSRRNLQMPDNVVFVSLQLREVARQGFATLEDPFAGLLDMLESCKGWKGKGHSLEYYIADELACWLKEHSREPEFDSNLKKLQARALGVLAESQSDLLEPLISVYQLQKADRNTLLGNVNHLYHNGKYKEAVILCTKLKLQPELDVEKMCTPLLLQDKANLVKDYVADYPHLQSQLLQVLDTWYSVLSLGLQPGQVVGIDMEWRPSFGLVGRPRVSVLQIATKEHVYLLDLLQFSKLDKEEKEKELCHFIWSLFSEPSITKLGYGMSGDLCSLSTTYPALREMEKQAQGILDLLQVDKQVRKEPSSKTKRTRHAEKGLSLLVQNLLGKPLDKREQLSNWEKRPLREEQILYAASDAYCLLEVYEVLCKDPANFGLTANLKECLAGKQSTKPRAEKQLSKQGTQSPSKQVEMLYASAFPEISAKDFSVVCDTMLQGLARYLRCLGVDVHVLENTDDHRKAAEIARKEGRIILTSGLPYQKLQAQVGEGRCFSVNCSDKAKQQALSVLKHFNVRVTLTDIFSRCQVCNCDKYLKISKEKIRHLMKISGCPKSPEEEWELYPKAESPALSETKQFPGCAYNPNCRWLGDSDLNAGSLTLKNGTTLQIRTIPLGVLEKTNLSHFYCCTQCGKVFWEGSHFGRVVSQFQEILEGSEPQSQSFYELN